MDGCRLSGNYVVVNIITTNTLPVIDEWSVTRPELEKSATFRIVKGLAVQPANNLVPLKQLVHEC
jgi:hypothetical protein